MNKFYSRTIIALMLLVPFSLFSQSPSWKWSLSGGNQYNDDALLSATDDSGYFYLTGQFQKDSVFVGPLAFKNKGFTDGYLLKCDSSGNIVWSITAGGKYSDIAYSIAPDNHGNVFLSGDFHDSITFGNTTLAAPQPPGQTNLTFLVKIDPSGNVLWAKKMTFRLMGNTRTDTAGNLYATIRSSGTEQVTIGSTSYTNLGGTDIYLVKFDPAGNLLWAKQAGGDAQDHATDLKVDINGNSFICGQFTHGSASFGDITLHSPKNTDGFVAKYNSAGSVCWAKQISGNRGNNPSGMAIDEKCNLYVAVTNGSDTLTVAGNQVLLNDFSAGVVMKSAVIKLDSSGAPLWGKAFAGSSAILAIAINNSGNLVCGGKINDSLLTGSVALHNPGAWNSGFVVAMDSSGNAVWGEAISGVSTAETRTVQINKYGQIFVAGVFAGDSLYTGSTVLINHGSNNTRDVFFGQLKGSSTTGSIKKANIVSHSLYPNPSSGIFEIHVPALVANGGTVCIYNALGQIVHSAEINNGAAVVHMTNSIPGYYFYSIIREGTVIGNGKLIIE